MRKPDDGTKLPALISATKKSRSSPNSACCQLKGGT